MVNIVLQKIESYGDEYIEKHLGRYSKTELETDWYKSLIFFFDHVFYQGRSDKLSTKIKETVIKTLNEYIKENGDNKGSIFSDAGIKIIEYRLKIYIGGYKEDEDTDINLFIKRVGKDNDIQMVISTLRFISPIDKRNIVVYSRSKIKDGKLGDHYRELQYRENKKSGIFSIGPKCSSFYLRDLMSLYPVDIQKGDLKYLQPIDVWVKNVACAVDIIDGDEKTEKIKEKIVEKCCDAFISPTKFNQGAWYIGHNSFCLLLRKLGSVKNTEDTKFFKL